MNEFVKALISEGKSPLIPDDQNLYGNLVGTWDFDWYDHLEDPEPRHAKGEWIFHWILEGLAIQDIFICPSRDTRDVAPQPDAAYSTSVRMYNPQKNAWDVLYTEWGCATQLEARRETDIFGEVIVQQVVGNDRLRWIFSDITPDSFRWQRMALYADDTFWKMEAELIAVRRK